MDTEGAEDSFGTDESLSLDIANAVGLEGKTLVADDMLPDGCREGISIRC